MTSLDNLGSEIYNLIETYSESKKIELEKLLDYTADKILDYIQKNAPRSNKKNAVADSFTKLDVGKGIHKQVIIYSKSRGRIIHFIEFGFKHRNGRFIPARAFMRPAFDRFSVEMIEEIKAIIMRGLS